MEPTKSLIKKNHLKKLFEKLRVFYNFIKQILIVSNEITFRNRNYQHSWRIAIARHSRESSEAKSGNITVKQK